MQPIYADTTRFLIKAAGNKSEGLFSLRRFHRGTNAVFQRIESAAIHSGVARTFGSLQECQPFIGNAAALLGQYFPHLECARNILNSRISFWVARVHGVKQNRPIEEEPAGETIIAQATAWLEECLRGESCGSRIHRNSPVPRSDYMPTRLIKITNDQGHFKLKVCEMEGQIVESYVALSYC